MKLYLLFTLQTHTYYKLAPFGNLFEVAGGLRVNHATSVAPLKPQEPEGRLSVARARDLWANGKIELEFPRENCRLQVMIYYASAPN